ncbi:hypothetical protein [Gimesia panareensis]|uniref:hypothetical protein n=1 Tax=Gimesia panareensis TaxID=2527978 RepID=UPI00118D2485|nr:hypothetical protein [Gimesia panareensis]QDU53544.1 hypothetical protein Pan110_59360 [Gimesia panareensis]
MVVLIGLLSYSVSKNTGVLILLGLIAFGIGVLAILDHTGLLTEWFDLPSEHQRRKIREQKETERFENLSEEGKLLYELNKKQEMTQKNLRIIIGMIFGGAIGFLVFFFWPF